ncbi:MAG: hypothetical protein RLY86_212 [Pseudomonadota bacterium]
MAQQGTGSNPRSPASPASLASPPAPDAAAVFTLADRLTADTRPVGDLPLCRVLLMANAAFPWLILVPRRPGAVELHHLDPADQQQVMGEMAAAARALEQLTRPDKINLGALGNLVPQLHIHVIARFRDDPAWPGPVWGSGRHQDYAPGAADDFTRRVAAALGISG